MDTTRPRDLLGPPPSVDDVRAFPVLGELRLVAEHAFERYVSLHEAHSRAFEIYSAARNDAYEPARRNLKNSQAATIDARKAYERARANYEETASLLLRDEQ